MTRTYFVLSCMLMFCVTPRWAEGNQLAAAKTNVVLILIDDLGWMDIGCYGSTYYQTPNIDRLAAEGMRFTDGYAACNVCSPTRAAIMTGRYGFRTGIGEPVAPGDIGLSLDEARMRRIFGGC